MSDTDTIEMNEQLILISGASGTGKSAALRNIRNQERWFYLNCEANKRLPFKNKFQNHPITDPYQVYEAFDVASPGGDMEGDIDGIIVDTSTFLMDMMESQYVLPAKDTQKAWGEYAQFWKNLMQVRVARFGKPVLILAHTLEVLDEQAHEMKVKVPVKGALKNQGIEAYFSTVVSTKKVTLKELEPYKNSMLNITEDDEKLGFKHVFQTRLTKATVGERIRSPMGMFDRSETYTDNCAQVLLDHLHEFYEG